MKYIARIISLTALMTAGIALAATFNGTSGGDTYDGTTGADNINGNGGNDRLTGREGNDNIDGGDGNDRLFGDLGTDIMNGGNGDDTINGNEDNDLLYGGEGADDLGGNGGDDFLTGGNGADILRGNIGNDIFLYNTVSNSTPNASDIITDFQVGSERIDLTNIDASTRLSGNQAFTWLGTQVFPIGGNGAKLRYYVNRQGTAIVQGEVNGDGTPDFVINLFNASGLSISNFAL